MSMVIYWKSMHPAIVSQITGDDRDNLGNFSLFLSGNLCYDDG